MNHLKTGRALQLEGLEFATNKVTIGFKCNAGTKIQLAQEANLYGLTLSEYVDTILGQRHHQAKQQKTEMTYSKEELEVLIKKIAFYENDRMQQAYETHKGNTLNIMCIDNTERQFQVNHIEDIFTIIMNLVKLS